MLATVRKEFCKEFHVTQYTVIGVDTMRISNCSQYVCAKLVLHVNGQQIHLTGVQDVLSNVIKGDFARFSEAEIAEMLLLLNNLTVAYNANSRVVKELKAAC